MEACPEDLRLLKELEAAVELAEVELVSRSAPETQVAIAARAELETVSSDLGMTKVKIGNMRKEVREAIPERRKEQSYKSVNWEDEEESTRRKEGR